MLEKPPETSSSSVRSRLGFSPLWLLAATADVTRGSRTYLDAFVGELRVNNVLAKETAIHTLDEILDALEGASGTTARLVDVPPLEVAALRKSLSSLRADASGLPKPAEMASTLNGLRMLARRERRSLLAVSAGVGTAFFNSARHVGRQHVLDPYGEDLAPLREEGFGAYAGRVSKPYAQAVRQHFGSEAPTWTERGLKRLRPTPPSN